MKRNIAIFLSILFLFVSCAKESDSNKDDEIVNEYSGRFSPNTARLMNYLNDVYGDKILSGQMDTSWTTNSTMDMIARVNADTGKYPAIKGFDLIQLPSDGGREQANEAIEWWDGTNKMNGQGKAQKLLPGKPDIHGIVTFCWHWNIDSKPNTFYSDDTTFRIPMKDGQLDTKSDAFTKKIKPTLDRAASALQLLKDRDIPVLWRPLHEAAGNWPQNNPNNPWFWWGASGPGPYICLWEYMYDYLTYEKGLNNLIWVWNGQNKAWFPSPDTVDIVSFDFYVSDFTPQTPKNYSSQKAVFDRTKAMVPEGESRMVALTENGAIPDPDNCKADGAMWLWFMVWNDSRNTPGETHKDNFWTGEHHNTNAHKQKVYDHELEITLDELPDLTKYRLE